jgi:hypothetical protein
MEEGKESIGLEKALEAMSGLQRPGMSIPDL